MKKWFLVIIITNIILIGSLAADQKRFAYGYTADTMPKGLSEIEVYVDSSFGDRTDPKTSKMKHQIEWEYGLADRLTTGLYGVFERTYRTELLHTQTKLRALYALAEKNKLPVDIALYVESKFAHQLDPATKLLKPTVAEGKFILSKDAGIHSFAASYVSERALIDNAITSNKYYCGYLYNLTRATGFGFEFQSQAGIDNPKQYIIPQFRTILWNSYALNFAYKGPITENAAKEESWRLILAKRL